MTLAEIRAALDAALAEMTGAHHDIEQAEDGADLTEVETRFSGAESRHADLRVRYDRALSLERAQEAQPPAPLEVPAVPEPSPGEPAGPSPAGQLAAGQGVLPEVVARSSETRVVSEPATYQRGGVFSFFQDAVRARFDHDEGAIQRLRANNAEVARSRGEFAISSGTGSAGDFVPPLYLQQDWIAIAQAARPFADAVGHMDLPGGTNVILFPRLATGAVVDVQTDNATVVSQDVTTGNVQVPVVTIAGQQDMSRQLLERSTPSFDQVIYQELTAKYHSAIDRQALLGTGAAGQMRGVLSNVNRAVVTYTDTAPTAAKLLPKINDAIQRMYSTRFLPPTLIVMHPRRWQWFLAAQDANGRPLVTPYAPQNAIAQFDRVAAMGLVGGIAGLPVLVDPNVPTNLGVGVNEDRVIVTRAEDLWLMEDDASYPVLKVFEETLSGTMSIRIQLYGYAAFSAERYNASIATIEGTGVASPTF